MDELLRDIRYGARSLLKTPGFAVVAIATIALGIGVNSTIFSLVNAVLFRPLAVANPDELVDIYGHTATSNSHDTHSYPNYVDYRDQTETLSGVIAYTNFLANLSIGGRSELVVGEIVSEDYFRVLGIQPTVGRAFAADEFVAVGAGPVAILNHAFWQSRFAADPGALGQPIRLNGIPYTVVGVAPEGFGGMFPAVSAQMWIPITMVEESPGSSVALRINLLGEDGFDFGEIWWLSLGPANYHTRQPMATRLLSRPGFKCRGF